MNAGFLFFLKLSGFLLASFPFFALTNRISSKTELDNLLEKIDKVIVDRACNVTGTYLKVNFVGYFKCFSFTGGCGECQTITEGGIIESPNYPDGYEPNLNCLFTIKAPLGMKIQLNFTEFLVKKCCDFITVIFVLPYLMMICNFYFSSARCLMV